MTRRNQKPSVVSQMPDKSQADRAMPPDRVSVGEPDNPFATFTEWSSAADEKAYAAL